MSAESKQQARERLAKERHEAEMRQIRKVILVLVIIIAAAAVIIAAVFIMSGKNKNAEQAAGQDLTLQTDSGLTIEDGDRVNIDYTGSVDGVEFQGGSTNGSGTDLVIGSGTYIDDFEAQLIGAHPGDTVNVSVTFPDNYGVDDLNGKDALFVVVVNGIYR